MKTENVKGKEYKLLLDLLSRQCNRFAFVENRQMMEFEEERLDYIDKLIGSIKGHLIERKIQQKWETSQGSAYVFYFHFNNATKLFLKDYSNSLFDWRYPELPEDIMFYKNNKCILAVCSHEKYFLVDETFWNNFVQFKKNKK